MFFKRNCEICGKEFQVKADDKGKLYVRTAKQKYCSHECRDKKFIAYSKAQKGKTKETSAQFMKVSKALTGRKLPKDVIKRFLAARKQRPCVWSLAQRMKARKQKLGAKNYSYKGGENIYRLKCQFKFKYWARLVKERDKVCVICGKRTTLIAHHLKPFETDIKERYNVRNGITLCKGHHLLIHVHKKTIPELIRKYIITLNRDKLEKHLKM